MNDCLQIKFLFVTKSGLPSLPIFIMNMLFCYISEKKKSWALKKSFFFAVLGFSLFFIPAYFSLSSSCLFSKLLSLLGIFCIIIGYLPYQRLSSLEKNPHKIGIENDFIFFHFFNSPLLKIKKNIIKEIKYVSDKKLFGMQVFITTKDQKTKLIFLEQRKRIVHKFLKSYLQSQTDNEIVIFFPYFNKSSCKRLKQYL